MGESWYGKRVLVTGGTGFIGSFLVEKLLEAGAQVRVPLRAKNFRALSAKRAEIEWLEGDLRDGEYCTRLTKGINHVFHLASNRRNGAFHQKRCSDVVNDNVRMTLALLEGIRENEISPGITFFSSANVPPAIDTVALSQQPTVDGYVLGKAICETLWFTAARQRHLPLLVVRPLGAYGPRDTFNEEANLIPMLMMQARDRKDFMHIWGDGAQEREFLYVEDLIGALFSLLDGGADGVQYVSSGILVTVRELAEAIRNLVKPGLPITYDVSQAVASRTIPVLPSHSALSTVSWTPLDRGLKNTYDWWVRA